MLLYANGRTLRLLLCEVNMTDLEAQITALRETRLSIARLVKELANRELDGRVLRLELETELRATMTKTDAEKEAKVHARYLAHERESIQKDFDRLVLEARAESQAFGLRLVERSTV